MNDAESQTWACVDMTAGPHGLFAQFDPETGRLTDGPRYSHVAVDGFDAAGRPWFRDRANRVRWLDDHRLPYVLYEAATHDADQSRVRHDAQRRLERSTRAPNTIQGLR